MAEKCSARRVKLAQVQALVQELISINEAASKTETQLTAMSVAEAEVEGTIDKILDSAGPPVESGGGLSECTGDKVTDRIVNLLNSAVSGGIDWDADAE